MKSVTLCWLLGAVLLVGGCGRRDAQAQQWAATATNTLGTLETQTDRKLVVTVAAFDAAMKELGFLKGETDVKLTEAVLTYRATADTLVTVKLKEFPSYTNIKVRCGLLGDETLSRQILAKFHRAL